MPLSAAQPGFPELLIAPLHAAVEPCRFETCAGDAVDSAAQSTRAGIADVRLEVFVIEQGVPFSLEIDARDDLATTIHVLARGADDAPLAAGRLLVDPGCGPPGTAGRATRLPRHRPGGQDGLRA